MVLDRHLVALVSMESRCRLVQARLSARLLDGKHWRSAGFVRLSDYAGERFGLKARTLQEDAHVARALGSLPSLELAFTAGAISWTHLRLLVDVATPSDEQAWIDLARTMKTRALEALVHERRLQMRARAARAASGNDVDSAPSSEPANACASGSADHAAAGAKGADLSSESANRRKPDSTVSTDGNSAADAGLPPGVAPDEEDPLTRWSIRVSRDGRRLWRQACEIAERAAGTVLPQSAVLELIAAEAMAGPAATPASQPFPPRETAPTTRQLAEAAERAFLAEYGSFEGFPWLEPAQRDPGAPSALHDLADRLLEGLEDADGHDLDRRLRELRAAMQRIDWQIGVVLRVSVGRRLYRDLGFATLQLYVESRLGMSYRKASFLVNLERKSWSATPDLRAAYRAGRLTPLKASAVMRLVDEEHGPAWIRRAGEVTLRRLTDEVTWALNRMDQGFPGHRVAPPPDDLDVRAEIFAAVPEADLQMRAHAPFQPDGPGGRATATVEMEVPESIARLVEEALSRVRKDWEPRWRAFERMVALAVLEWTSVPRHRDPVFARDGWRCAVPGCRSRRDLHDHHLEFRSRLGGNEQTNRASVCAAHHHYGIHGGGGIQAEGTAPHAILWRLGCRPGREPLMQLLGDRYLSVA